MTRIADVMANAESVPYITVPEHATVHEVSERVQEKPQTRGIYVEDKNGEVCGYISLGVLVRHLVESRQKPMFHVRSLLARITARQAGDLMERNLVYARADDELHQVLDRMLNRNMKMIPVLDDRGGILANLSILDLWRFAAAYCPI